MKTLLTAGVSALAGVAFSTVAAFAGGHSTVKVAFIDPLSGSYANTGVNGLHQFEFAAEKLVNEKGGVLGGTKLEIVALDNKVDATESLAQLQFAIDLGIRFVAQGASSGVADAIADAVKKHNRANHADRVLFLDYSTVDPALADDECNPWHFRFDANADIKVDALTDVIADDHSTKKIYVIGQDYSFGKAVADAASEMLGEKRPDIEIVGSELHPLGRVTDFTPYAQDIVASGADAVITGNWGADMLGLGKAVAENGFEGPIYSYYAPADGIAAALGENGDGSVRLVAGGRIDPPATGQAARYYKAFKARRPDGEISQSRITDMIEMLAKAIDRAGSATDVVAIAGALEGMEHKSLWGGSLLMRASDRRLIEDILAQAPVDEGVKFDHDNSGDNVAVEGFMQMAAAESASSCDVKRQ